MDDEIAHAFKNGDYMRALELLPNVRDQSIKVLDFSPEKYKHIYFNTYNVSLLHLAAYHGWLDICDQLITEYKYNPHVPLIFGSLIDHSKSLHLVFQFAIPTPPPPPLFYATLGGHIDIVTYLIKNCKCDPHQDSKDGEIPLYLACFRRHYEIVTYLSRCNPTIGILNIRRDTPLHIACLLGELNTVEHLLPLSSVDVNAKDPSGHTPLHMVCLFGGLQPLVIANLLLSSSSVDVNIRNKDGFVPLHIACHHGLSDIIKLLVSKSSVDVNVEASDGSTPLHTACHYGNLGIVNFLLSLSSVDINIKNNNGYTPLHTACHYGNLDIVKFFVFLPLIDVNSKASDGYTPLHTACHYGNLDIVKFLASLSFVRVKIEASDGYTPLHTACRFGNLDIVKFLVSLSFVDVKIEASDGYTPLHTACRYSNLDIVKFLLSISSVDVNSKALGGYTPLHTACHYGELVIVQLLMSTAQVNPISTTMNGDTPLHIACRHNRVDIVKYLLSTGRIDPVAKNRYQRIPVQMAGDKYQILKIFEPFKQCRVDFPVESYSKVFLCGNTTNGKSSLAHALLQRVNGVHISWIDRYSPFKYRHEQAEPLTAGIVPHHLQSNEIGNIVLYDFAGHPEYYSSHEAVLDNLMLRSPAVFIILIKLTDKLEDIDKQLYYWAGFLENVGYRMSKKSQVIVVGSHADKRRAENGINHIKRIDIQRIIEYHEYKGFVAMDCRNKDGVGFDEFVTCLSESTKTVVKTSDSISFYCHVLYAFLKTKLDQVAITLDNLLQRIKDENEPSLPSNESVLLEFLTILSDKGLILFIRSTDSINSWVIINKTSLLKEINGTLFAPSHFKEYRSTLTSNTGIVPVSVLSDVFPQYDPDMLVGFLKSLEFCHEIDENTLKIITTNLSSSSEKLIYFPALVSVEPSSEVTITDGFGWCLWCPNPYQFFSNRFLQVLLLRIAYLFSLQINDVGIIHVSPVQTLDRSCRVWKNGICWTRDGVKIVVQVSEQNRSVILLVKPLVESLELESLQVSSSVIQKILQIKKEFCHSCDTRECLISPHNLNMALQYNLKDLSVFKIEDIARVLVMKRMFVTSNMTESLNISSLLGQLEPYHSLPLSVIHQLFNDSNVSQHIPEHVFRKVRERCRPIMDIYPVTSESSTYQSVRDHLNRFSIFAGRNPFVSE